jgi:hypothetical protein
MVEGAVVDTNVETIKIAETMAIVTKITMVTATISIRIIIGVVGDNQIIQIMLQGFRLTRIDLHMVSAAMVGMSILKIRDWVTETSIPQIIPVKLTPEAKIRIEAQQTRADTNSQVG